MKIGHGESDAPGFDDTNFLPQGQSTFNVLCAFTVLNRSNRPTFWDSFFRGTDTFFDVERTHSWILQIEPSRCSLTNTREFDSVLAIFRQPDSAGLVLL